MKSKKMLPLIVFCFIVTSLLTGCSSGKTNTTGGLENNSSKSNESGSKITIRWGHFAPADDPIELGIKEMAKRVKERTNGKVEIQSFPNSQLGSIPEMFEQLQQGSLQMMFVNSSVIGNMIPEFTIFDAPFVFDDVKHAREFARSDIAQTLAKKLLESKGVRILDASPIFGTRHLSTKATEVHQPTDLKGLKIRVHEAQTRVDLIKAWGAQPVVTPTGEMYLALQSGLADGQESPLSWQAKNKYWEVQKYIMLTGHFVQNENIVINEKFFKGLPEDIQKILKEEVVKVADFVTEGYQMADQKAAEELTSHGMVIVKDIDKEAFRKATEAMWTKYNSKWGIGVPQKVVERKYKVLSPEEWQKY